MVKEGMFIVNSNKSIAAYARKAALEGDHAAREAKPKEDDFCWLAFEGAKSRAAMKREQEALYKVNKKSIAARVRKAALVTNRAELEAKQEEDAYWREAEGAKSRAAKKREQEAEKKAETAAKKAEARRLAEEEKKELEQCGWKADKKAKVLGKIKRTEYLCRIEKEEAEFAREEMKKASRVLDEEEYEMMVSMPNVNRDVSIIDTKTVEDALEQLTMPVGMHPKGKRKPDRRMVQISCLLSDSKKFSSYIDSFKKGKNLVPEVTEEELVDKKETRRIVRGERKKASRVLDEEEYECIIEAKTVGDALANLTMPVDMHPQGKRKAGRRMVQISCLEVS